MSLQDKVAVVTGAASGIGKHIAKVFFENGAKVVIADLDMKATQASAHELDPSGLRTMAFAMNVTSESEVDAGIQIVAPMKSYDFSNWKKLLAIHLDGAFLTTRACLKLMYTQKRGGSVI